MSKWTYNRLQITGCTEDERIQWTERALERGYRTLSSFLRDLLEKFEDLGQEDIGGSVNVVVCSFNDKKIDVPILKRRSRHIRKFINEKTKGR
jgi:hypothetical protein